MLHIRAIRIEVHTTGGLFTAEYSFSNGLNIIKGRNTAGKSTLFQAILYGIGMEELLGGKNEKTMQSALRDAVEYPEDHFHPITESQVFLEIENRNKITTQRSIKGAKSSKLIRVFYGGLLTEPEESIDFIDTWVHDKGGASNTLRGFHNILEQFLGWDLPDVYYSSGDFRKLYLQTIFPSFVVEQKSGWADFLATIPFFGIRNAESRALEFLLDLDVFENEQKRQALKDRKASLNYEWKSLFADLQGIAKRGAVEVSGIPNEPQILSKIAPVNTYAYYKNTKVPLSELIESFQEEYEALKIRPVSNLGKNIDSVNTKLVERQKELDELTLGWELLNQRLRSEKIKVEQYESQLKEIREELRQNNDVKKIYKLGGEADIPVAKNICPTCNQDFKDSLFMPEVHLTPMNIEDNIRYVEAQEKMVLIYLNVEKQNIIEDEKKAASIFNSLSEIRKEIRTLKEELISDERLPSVAEIEERIRLKNKIYFYEKLQEEIVEKTSSFVSLSEDWSSILKDEEKLPKAFLSKEDFNKIIKLESNFKALLKKFEYTSKDSRAISISKESDKKFLLPVVESEGVKYNIRFDSSGSDLIKALWSYYCALFSVGFQHNTNHPHLLIFDEPAQQGVGSSGFNKMIKELVTYKDGQSFLFSSFNESESFYAEAVRDVAGFTLIEIEERSIMPA